MSVYIKGMEMPKSCYECWALDDDYDYPMCRITQEQRGYNFDTRGRKMAKCPLINIPEPHGRLIDADKALDKLFRDKREAYTKHSVWLMFSIHGAPTVIERSET